MARGKSREIVPVFCFPVFEHSVETEIGKSISLPLRLRSGQALSLQGTEGQGQGHPQRCNDAKGWAKPSAYCVLLSPWSS